MLAIKKKVRNTCIAKLMTAGAATIPARIPATKGGRGQLTGHVTSSRKGWGYDRSFTLWSILAFLSATQYSDHVTRF